MVIRLVVLDKTKDSYLREGINQYLQRLNHYCTFEYVEISIPKGFSSLPKDKRMIAEAGLIEKHIPKGEQLFLLDDKGKSYDSNSFSSFLSKRMVAGGKGLSFVIGGPYGFPPSLKSISNGLISLSKMTFTHDMVRLIFVEQLYRAFTILRGEKYHHD